MVQSLLSRSDFVRLPLQLWQSFSAYGQQHVEQTGFANRRIGDADVVPHELRDNELSL